MRLRNFICVLTYFLFLATPVFSQKFIISCENPSPKTYEPVQISFGFVNMKASAISFPKIDGLRILSGPSQYTNSTNINGKSSSSTEMVYEVMFTKPGKVVFPKFYAKHGNNKIASNVLTFDVRKGRSPFPPGYEGKEGLVVLRESKKTAYLGECISIDLLLYSIANSVSITGAELPEFNDGWVQDIKGPKNEKFVLDNYKGKPYFKFDYAKIWLVPVKTGTITYDPVRVIFTIYVRLGNAVEEDFFGVRRDELSLPFDIESNPAVFEIKELPVEDKPRDFVNAIGSFTSSIAVDKNTAKVNEPIRLKLKVSGNGNFPIMGAPPLYLPEGFESFEPKVKDNFKVQSDGISGTREFEYYIVPKREGEFTIGPVTFSFFQPDKNSYAEIKSDSFNVSVKGFMTDTTGKAGLPPTGIFNQERPFKLSEPFFGNPVYYILLGLPFLVAVIFFVFRNRLFFRKPDAEEKNMKAAESRAVKLLNELKPVLGHQHPSESIVRLSNIFIGYLSDKLAIPRNQVSRAVVMDKLTDPVAGTTIKLIYDEIDMAKFSPNPGDMVKPLFDKIEELIKLMSR